MGDVIGELIEALDAVLAGAGDEAAAAFRPALRRARTAPAQSWPDVLAFDLPVCRFWEVALDLGAPADLVTPLRDLGPRLVWTQNPNYRRSPVATEFLNSYGYAVIAGPADGPPALAASEALAFGVLLLGPGTRYPLHAHPAAEIYVPLNGAEWWRGEGPWTLRAPGSVIYHAPNEPHATHAGDSPLLALYLWRGDLATHARLT